MHIRKVPMLILQKFLLYISKNQTIDLRTLGLSYKPFDKLSITF